MHLVKSDSTKPFKDMASLRLEDVHAFRSTSSPFKGLVCNVQTNHLLQDLIVIGRESEITGKTTSPHLSVSVRRFRAPLSVFLKCG